MEILAAVGPIENIVVIVNLSCRLISTELCRPSKGALRESIKTKIATKHLLMFSKKPKDYIATTGENTSVSMYIALYHSNQLLVTLKQYRQKANSRNGRA